MTVSADPSDWMGKTEPDGRRALVRKFTEEERKEWPYHWRKQGREAQFAPPGDNTYANYREANRALWRLTLLPLLGKILKGLQAGMSDWFAEPPSVDLDRVPALSEDREKLWSQVTSADFLDADEKRELLGLPARKVQQ